MNKEEIEKAKERVGNLGKSIQANCKGKSNMATSIEMLLQYISELEHKNNKLQDIINNKVHYIKCKNCGIEIRVKRSDAKYCKKCSQKLWYKNLSEDKKKQRAEKSKISMQKIRLARRSKLDVK